MSCSELFYRFVDALDEGDVDFRSLRRLLSKCRRWAVKAIGLLMFRAWAYYKDSAAAPAFAYWRVVDVFWDLVNWFGLPCRTLAEVVTYVAEAAAKYSWPLKWTFFVMAAVAAEERGCRFPAAVAEALGPEYEALRTFLERGEAVVEVAGRKKAIIRKKSSITVVNLDSLNFEKQKEIR
jgi:hypothetical protein